ncbi:MAG: diguanylate cyclase [Magnetococcales bacterium]|nr:diguanylate cyclase [Magnetococcales bacterium]
MTIRKIHLKFTLLFSILLLIVLVGIGTVAFQVTEKAVVENALQSMRNRLDERIHMVELFQSLATNSLRMTLENDIFSHYFQLPETIRGNRRDEKGVMQFSLEQMDTLHRIDAWIRSVQEQYPVVESCLIDRTGQEHLRLTKGVAAPVEDFSATENQSTFFAPTFQLGKGGVFISDPYISPDAEEWVFAFSSPVVLPEGDKPAFLHFEIPLSHFQEIVLERSKSTEEDENGSRHRGRLVIVDDRGLVVADSEREIDLRRKSSGNEPHAHGDEKESLRDYLSPVTRVYAAEGFRTLIARRTMESSGWGHFKEGGNSYYVVFGRLPIGNWTVMEIKSYDQLLDGIASLNTIRNVLAGNGLIILVLAVMTIWWLSQRLTRPIKEISLAMAHIEEGNWSQRVPVATEDELGQMARVFNKMTRYLSETRVRLQHERNKLTTIIHSAREGIVVTDAQGHIALVNPSTERLLQKVANQIASEGFLNLVDDPEYIRAFLQRKGKDMPGTLVYKGKVLQFHASVIEEDGETIGTAALIRDITEEKRLEEQLRSLSFRDALTGLYNRRFLEETINTEYERASRYDLGLSVLFFDVDHFKKFNDTHGHDMGDRVLQELSRVAMESFRDVDFCCRYGGEEFCIILPSTMREGAGIAAERFREQVERTLVEGLHVTVSIGAVSYPQVAVPSAEQMIKLADRALYECKRGGRNQVRHYTGEGEEGGK